jgi:Double zinc ribbon
MDERRKCPQCRADIETHDSACPFCDAVLKEASVSTATSPVRPRRAALEPCPDCGAAVSVRAQSCPQCGCPPKGKLRPRARTLVRAIVATFFLIAFMNRPPVDRRTEKAPPNPPQIARSARAVLSCKSGDGVFVAFGIEAWSRLAHAQARQDTTEMERLANAGQIALVAAGTPVELLDSGTVMLKFRILAGPFENHEGWVRKEFVRTAP